MACMHRMSAFAIAFLQHNALQQYAQQLNARVSSNQGIARLRLPSGATATAGFLILLVCYLSSSILLVQINTSTSTHT